MKKNWKQLLAIMAATTIASSVSACGQTQKSTNYQPTEENENPELTMSSQPESSYWFPNELLAWEASDDPDFIHNVSTVPLAKRVDREKLETINSTQNKDTNIMAISIMNSSTSGNAPHGLNKSNVNTFSYWQYVDTLVYWGGSSGEGLIVPPSPDVVDAGHKNGVKVLGTIFFPQNDHGGKMEWLDEFLVKDSSGTFPLVAKLIEVAESYGFDGWFFNQETEGSEDTPLTAKHAALTEEFIQQFKEQAPALDLVYYDSMTKDGKIDWQNALTSENVNFMKSEDGKVAADSMFLNFWWTDDDLVSKELLKNSAAMAEESGIDPYSLYAGVDIQSDGYLTPIRWDLLSKSPTETYTSLGLYCPNWAYSSASDMEDYWAKENAIWVNSKEDPSQDITYNSDTEWRGISSYAVERTAITSLPFTTNFNTGNGYCFFKDGTQISKLDWNNRSISDIPLTYRYMIKNEGGNKLNAGIDVANAWYGGSSLKLRGDVEKGVPSNIKLYSCELDLSKDTIFTTTAKADSNTKLSLVVGLEDGKEISIPADKAIEKEWTTVSFDMKELNQKTIRSISFELVPEESSSGYQFYFGNITISDKETYDVSSISDVTIDGHEFDEDAMFAGVRLNWKSDKPAEYYEVYRINQDKTKSLLGVSNTESFYINTLPRTDDTNKSTFEVVPVTKLLESGKGSEVTMEWPDNSLPKANFGADKTLAAPGENITFESLCSLNTESVSYSFPGADTENAEGDSATISYSKEGTYDVTITAKNKSGTAEKKIEGFIVITNDAKDGTVLLSKDSTAEASSFVNENEAPKFAVDGDKTKKWCATGSAPHELTLDLGDICTVNAVDIVHAEGGGEGPDMNTKSYSILTSEDGKDFKEAISITKNTSGTTHDTLAPAKARYVRLVINKPTQGSDSAARIYEMEVYGLGK